jgi:hypothetical protein
LEQQKKEKTMINERLISILRSISNNDEYVILIDGEVATVNDNEICISDGDGCYYSHSLESLRICRERGNGTSFDVMIGNSGYTLQVARIFNINSL